IAAAIAIGNPRPRLRNGTRKMPPPSPSSAPVLPATAPAAKMISARVGVTAGIEKFEVRSTKSEVRSTEVRSHKYMHEVRLSESPKELRASYFVILRTSYFGTSYFGTSYFGTSYFGTSRYFVLQTSNLRVCAR